MFCLDTQNLSLLSIEPVMTKGRGTISAKPLNSNNAKLLSSNENL